ncbi:hypothetical protein O181_020819 [Austropuccinia psidii MF-1]|uniref:Uncharacterized protein n=1 Tax=Austropuccinia psidii MF-1 TaxID=1389203 RepID=A0A9Q3GW26_9BASI|nr:hypothetical protein [Austropuccinia psidii MF-1]
MKTALIFFTLQSCAHCPSLPGFSWLGRAGKAGEVAAGGGKAENGARTGADLRGAHVDPAHADGGSLGGELGTPNTKTPFPKGQDAAPKTQLPPLSKSIQPAADAGAIKAAITGALKEPFSKAADIFAKLAPNLYRRLRVLILDSRPRDPQTTATFKAQFKGASASRQYRIVIDTFHSLNSESTFHTTEQMENWAESIGEVMHIEDPHGVQNMMVEAQLQKELCSFMLKAIKENPRSSLYKSLPKFQELEVNLYNRVKLNPQAVSADKSYQKLNGGAEILNLDKWVHPKPDMASTIPVQFQKNKLIAPILARVLYLQDRVATENEVLTPINQLVRIMRDPLLDVKGFGYIHGFKSQNPYTLEDRMAAASALVHLYGTRHQLFKAANLRLFVNSNRIVRKIEEIFVEKPTPSLFLHPNFRRVTEGIDSYKTTRPYVTTPPWDP